ncbi:crossover junction endodeoxyribonuclease RuvC [uncultured Paenibacillus sp.]|uniref:crossover junction endodeoxyribonuclease RuvC n=1 Tax=uncultured Paenibacillus sp. TaxID=227322 RepID=UPI0015ADBCAA|nr:crossover junction endodeoxyribonuclease RuvC [uncultured Paenibacillus sp.]
MTVFLSFGRGIVFTHSGRRALTLAKNKSRYAGLDLSLTSPGFAVIDVIDRVPHLVALSVVKTESSEDQPLRYEVIEAHALLFFREHKPDAAIVREIWPPSRNYVQNDKVHGAWSAVDRALARLNLAVADNLSPQTVKKTVTGNGRAEKAEVAEAVRRWLRLPSDYQFRAGYDDSDAAAVCLAYLIRENLIDHIPEVGAA